MQLTTEQDLAFRALLSGENVFLTGGAGTGKSFLIRKFLLHVDSKYFPVLASTGSAAILIGGRTFHSFFGLGIMEGGAQATLERGSKDKRLMRRLRKIEGFVLDEVSMIPGPALSVAARLCQIARENDSPWGGARVIAVGDFAQLPPVDRFNKIRQWAFQEQEWANSGFYQVTLKSNVRCQDPQYAEYLNKIRMGEMDSEVTEFLNEVLANQPEAPHEVMRLFPRRNTTHSYNQSRLSEIESPSFSAPSIYSGEKRLVDRIKKVAPVPDVLNLKQGARVMILQNDPKQRWFNGTMGTVTDFEENKLHLELDSGREVELERSLFSMLDAEGNVLAAVSNFPVNLAYATTIHKSQGVTLDAVAVDLRSLWEPGQAYVALSRLSRADGLYLLGWNPQSVIVAPEVQAFYGYQSQAPGEEIDRFF